MAHSTRVAACPLHGEYFLDADDSPCPSCEDAEDHDNFEYRVKNVECSIDGEAYVEWDTSLNKEILRRKATPEEIDHFQTVDGVE